MSPATKTIKAHVSSATNPTAFPRKPSMAPTALLMIAGNASAAFPASHLRASDHFVGLALKGLIKVN